MDDNWCRKASGEEAEVLEQCSVSGDSHWSRSRQEAKRTPQCKNMCVSFLCQKQVKCSGCSQPVGWPFCTSSRSVCRKLQS